MSVEQTGVVDIMSVDGRTGHVVLTVSDHLDWSDSPTHQKILQDKLNRYLAFVESGEILASYPEAKDRPVTFKVVFKFSPDDAGRAFLSKVRQVIESAGFTLHHEVYAASYDN